MAKGVGLDAGEFEIKVVELDGSYRKPRLTSYSVDRVSQPTSAAADEAHAAREAEAAFHAIRDAKIARDNVVLGFPCREAVLRILEIPFRGAEQIRKVIKFEVEDSIHSHNVDDMVVDFHTLEELAGATRVLVAAVPKQPLRVTLDALNEMGVDPEVVDLDTMALYRAAEWAGCFSGKIGEAAAGRAVVPVDEEESGDLVVEGLEEGGVAGRTALDADLAPDRETDLGDEPPVPMGAAEIASGGVPAGASGQLRVVIDVGGRSTRIVAVVDGEIVDMRALRHGIDAIADDIAGQRDIDVPTAREAVYTVLATGVAFDCGGGEAEAPDAVDLDAEAPDAEALDAEEGAVATTEPTTSIIIAPDEVSTATTELLRRIHLEFVRFIASLRGVNSVEAVWVTGGGSFLPGLDKVIEDAFGCAPRPLPILENLSHNLSEEDAAHAAPRIAVAVGLALGSMGGPRSLQFRQEDLAFQRSFDRVKFPLAVACMLGMFCLFIYWMKLNDELDRKEKEYGQVYEAPVMGDRRGQAFVEKGGSFYGYVANFMNSRAGFSTEQILDRRKQQELLLKVVDTPVFERLKVIRKFLEKELEEQRRATGVYQDLQLPSGFLVLSQLCAAIQKAEPDLGSFVVPSISLNTDGRVPSAEFEIALRGPGFRGRFERLKSVFENEFANPDSVFAGFASKQRGEDPYETTELQGAIYTLKFDLKEAQ